MSPFSVAVAKGAQSVAEYFAGVGNACVHLPFGMCSNLAFSIKRNLIVHTGQYIPYLVCFFPSTIRIKYVKGKKKHHLSNVHCMN